MIIILYPYFILFFECYTLPKKIKHLVLQVYW